MARRAHPWQGRQDLLPARVFEFSKPELRYLNFRDLKLNEIFDLFAG